MMIYTVDGPRQLHKTAWTENSVSRGEKNTVKLIFKPQESRLTKAINIRGPGIPGFYYFTRINSTANNNESPILLKRKRIFWLLIYAACVTLCTVQMSERLNYFLQYPMSMSLTTHPTNTWDYPDLTICPFHGMKSGNILNATLNRFCPTATYLDKDIVNCTDHVYDMLDYLDNDINRLWNMSGNDLFDTVIDCLYQEKASCKRAEFWRTDFTMMGRCYTLTEPLAHGGPWMGIRVLLKEAGHVRNDGLYHLRWKVLLHKNNTVLEYSTLTRSTMIYRQTSTSLMFWQKEYYYESTPINPCTTMEEVKDCLTKCSDRLFLQKSNCRLPFMKTLGDMPLCKTPSEFRANYRIPVHTNEFQDKIESCECGRSCHEVNYESQPDFKKEPMEGHMRLILYPTSADIEIVRERRAYPLNSLISDLGGALGLYLGICILTLMETVRFTLIRAFCKPKA